MGYKTLKDNNLTSPHILLGLRGCLLALFAAFVLTACGGGGGAATPVTTPPVVGNCPTDPFGATCGNEYAAQRAEKINECLIEDMATEDTSCASAVNAQSCLTDPFAAGCDEDTGFSVFLEVAKDEREAFCNMGDNASDTLCAGAVSTLCGDNPFNGLCKAASYIQQQGEIVADCITEGKAGEPACANAVEFNPCIHNPFTPECPTAIDARTMREAFCRKDDNATNALCTGALVHFCELDPFDAICDATAYSRQQMERVDFCISDANASNNTLCANAVAQDACIRDPFTAACITQGVFRSIREAFCREGTNAADNPALCGNAVVNICTNDPFDSFCDPSDYSSHRATRTAVCITGDNASDDALCANAIGEDDCIENPFTTECESKTDARTMRETYCRDGNEGDPLCAGAVVHFCDSLVRPEADPFDELCGEVAYGFQRTTRTTACITGDKADDSTCANAVKFNPCIGNPFTAECSTQTDARTMREAHCRAGNEADSLCAGAVVHFCAIDPFDGICDDADYSQQQMERTALCIKGANASDAALCNGAIGQDECINNPFGTNCDSKLTAQTARETFCRADNENNGLCAGAVLHFCTADPFDELCNATNFTPYATARGDRVTACITGDNASDDALCANAIGEDKCILDPYGMDCESQDSSPTAAQTARTTFCRAGNEGNALCASTVKYFCDTDARNDADPFDALCDPDTYTEQRNTRMNECSSKDSNDPRCINAFLQAACVIDPFLNGCDGQIDRQTAHEVFCRKGTNAADRLSDCQNTINRVCGADPFDSICKEGNFATFVDDRAARVLACIAGDKANDDDLCANAIVANPCIRDPYGAGCDGETDARDMRESHCRASNEDTALCTGTVNHFCAIDPFEDLCNATNFPSYTSSRGAFEAFCRADVAGRANDAGCQNAVTHFCTVDPFDSLCNMDNFTTFTNARNTRNSLCRDNQNALGLANDSQCTGVLAHFCTIDPFDTVCNPTTYTNERTGRVAECIMDDNASDTALCANAILANNCISNPYGTNCGSETAARTARETFCRGDPSNPSNPLCAGAVTHFCATSPTANPFDADLCMTYGSTRDSIIRSCITADDTRLEEGACTNALVANPCIRTPFDRNCITDFAPYYQDARTKRTTFCAARTDNTHALCAGAVATNPCFNNPFVRNLDNGAEVCLSEFAARREVQINKCIVGEVGQTVGCINVLAGIGGCLANPFHSSCHADMDTNSNPNTYFKDYADDARAERVAFCEVDDSDDIRDHDYCFGRTFNHDICLYDPYSRFCKDEFFNADLNTTVKEQRTEKVVFCGGDDNEQHGSCAHVRERVTAATWAHGFVSALNTRIIALTNEFLRADNASELNKGSSGAQGTKLNLATSTFDYNAFGGDATDGVEFFEGSSNFYYAGILGGADLGKPLSGATRTLYWNGRISSTISTGKTNLNGSTEGMENGTIVETDFTLTINFNGNGGTLESFAKAFLDDPDDTYYYDIEGDFNARGLITRGTVVYAEFREGDKNNKVPNSTTDAILSGIIGEDGALGVFQGADFSGGFVVHPTIRPRVESGDWERSFGDIPPATVPTAENQFLKYDSSADTTTEANADEINTGTLTREPTQNGLNLTPLLRRIDFDVDRNDLNNVSWFSGYDGNTLHHYAGLSETVYLGEPVTQSSGIATWYGKIGIREHSTDFELDLTFDGNRGTIAAFVREKVGTYYLLAGDFDRAGVIKNGTVDYGAFTNGVRNSPVGDRQAGVLTGLIGADGALGVFHSTATGVAGYSGGFAASAGRTSAFNTNVNYADWSRSFLPLAASANTANPENQFTGTVAGVKEGSGGTGGSDVTAKTLSLNTTDFDGGNLGGQGSDTIRWFDGFAGSSTERTYYSGLSASSDLGAPLTTTPAGGEWRGVISVGGAQTDFTLTITYETAGGTLSAFVRNTPNFYYLLDGGFDANGLIDGTVRYGAFTDNDPDNKGDVAPSGLLTGLIGEDGALGVFHSTATGAAGYSGGFVAHKDAPDYDTDVKYSDYQRSFLSLGLGDPDTDTPKNQFVSGESGVFPESGGTGDLVTNTNLGLNTQTLDGKSLSASGGDSNDFVGWRDGFVAGLHSRTHYAGLGENTDLGAPISGTSGMTANWRGVFAVGDTKTDFTLTITFIGGGGGTIDARIRAFVNPTSLTAGAFYYDLDGDFDATSGLITGKIYYGQALGNARLTETGVLTGLIGADGAVGAFYSNAIGPSGYSGGFVASDNVTEFDDTNVRYETWARSLLLGDTPDTDNPRNQFLRAQPGGTLDTSGGDSSRIIDLRTATFNNAAIGGLATNRYQSFDRTIGSIYRNYLGILPGTNLGERVVDGSTELTWYGNLSANYSASVGTRYADFVLNLEFRGAGGSLSARINHQNDDYYILNGTFDAGGLITGTVAFDPDAFITTPNGVLTGLIGAQGAIGVFHGNYLVSTTSRNYGGGFVARPKSDTFTDSVKYSDWVARENVTHLTAPITVAGLTATSTNAFLLGDSKTILNMGVISGSVGNPNTVRKLNLDTTDFDEAPIFGDGDDGVAYFHGRVGSGNVAFSGIYDTTDLGAPLTSAPTGGEWHGVIGFNELDEMKAVFTITFDGTTGTTGTIKATLENVSGSNDFAIDGTFDDLGIITGTTNFGIFSGSSRGPAEGTLSGLIGAEGAVGAFYGVFNEGYTFAYSGGFIASPDVKLQVNWSDWNSVSFRYGLTSQTGISNAFLRGSIFTQSTLKISTDSDASTATRVSINLKDFGPNQATYKDQPLGGNNGGRIDYYHGFKTGNSLRFYFAQIADNTKLGAVIEQTSGTAEYKGRFRAYSGVGATSGVVNTDTDFTLKVTFGASGGTLDAFVKQTEIADIQAEDNYFHLTGSYDVNGVITGDVDFGAFRVTAEGERGEQIGSGRRPGYLSGLISQDNTMGVFIGGGSLGASGTLNDGRGDRGFVGGFVARAFVDDNDPNTADYNDWVRIANPDAVGDTRPAFVQAKDGTISALNSYTQTTVTLASASFDLEPINGDLKDGFAVSDSFFGYRYAGILDSTDLGAPLRRTNQARMTWGGFLVLRREGRDFSSDFFLNINFETGESGTITTSVNVRAANNSFVPTILAGSFDANGVLTGTVTADRETGPLSGLIGQDNAVGVFYNSLYSGGFVANRNAQRNPNITYADWVRGQDYSRTLTSANQFLLTTGDLIAESTTGRYNLGGLNLSSDFEGVSMGGDIDDGFVSFQHGTPATYGYAGIYSTTDLGGRLTERSGKATWLGLIRFAQLSLESNFDLTFSNTGGTIKALYPNLSTHLDLAIDGTFDSNGVISGKVHYARLFRDDASFVPSSTNGTLSGIIGQDGAVGAFYGATTFNYSGGFVARPTSKFAGDGKVKYNDWTRGTITDAAPDAVNVRNQFLRMANNTIQTGSVSRFTSSVGTPTIRTLNFSELTHNGESLGLGADNGLSRFFGFIPNTNNARYAYAGIYGTTDLGAPIVDSSFSASWVGRLGLDGVTASNLNRNFTLDVAFDGTSGTVDGFLLNIFSGRDFLIDGDFDAQGVISGTVHYAEFPSDIKGSVSARNGVLSGIIGLDGAVGVFYSTGSLFYSGGFVAAPTVTAPPPPPPPPAPDADPNVVVYNDWTRVYNPDLHRSTGSKFLQTTNKALSTVGTGFTRGNFSFNLKTTEYGGEAIYGDADDGFAFYWQNSAYYAGIFNTTDLGMPITEIIENSLMWNGVVAINSGQSDAEFTITFGGTDGTITAFVPNVGGGTLDLSIAGTFDAGGVIAGNTHYAAFASESNPETPDPYNGTLSGLIGSGGAVAVFHNTSGNGYGGGFIASPTVITSKAAWDDWHDSFGSTISNLPFTPFLGAPDNNFLYGRNTTLFDIKTTSTAGAPTSTPFTISLGSTATYDGDVLGGAGVGEIRYWHGFKTGDSSRLYYAQISENTNLGALIERTEGKATYNGRFTAEKGGASIVSTDTDFTLTVSFGGSGDIAGNVTAFVKQADSGNLHYLLEGTYDENGVIKGDVTFDNFTVSSRTPEGGATQRVGILRGLISQDYALGAFVSGDITGSRGLVRGTDSRGDRGFVGGFAAGFAAFTETVTEPVTPPTPPTPTTPTGDADYAAWRDSFTSPALSDVATAGNKFLTTTNGELNAGDLRLGANGVGSTPVSAVVNLDAATYNGRRLNHGRENGFAFFYGYSGPTQYAYAGILDSTDLGAPLRGANTTTATFNGAIYIGFDRQDFTLNITFNSTGGDINAFAENFASPSSDLFLEGTFGANGVIEGTTNYGEYTNNDPEGAVIGDARPGILSGLIGVDAAVGVFYYTNSPVVGGFVAVPFAPDADPTKVRYDDWVRLENPNPTPTAKDQFLQGLSDTLDATGSTEDVLGNNGLPSVTTVTLASAMYDGSLISGGDSRDGFAFFEGYVNLSEYTYAGILSGTDLGAPFIQTDPATTFNGVVYVGTRMFDFTLNITYDNTGGGLKAFVPNYLASPRNARDFLLTGKFDAGGVISGSVSFAEYAGNDPAGAVTNGTAPTVLSGLIGKEGAVGVFYNGFDSGGFVASPDAVQIINYPNWRDSFDLPPWSHPTSSPESTKNQFLGSNSTLNTTFIRTTTTSSTDITPTILKMSDAMYDGQALSGDATDGVSFASGFRYSGSAGTTATTRNFYALIDEDVSLGEALPIWVSGQPVMAMWKGRFAAQHGDGTGTGNTTNTKFDLEVDFQNREVEAFVPVASGSTTHYYLEGSFAADLNGAIVGTVDRKVFANGLRTDTTGTPNPGIFTGLIGQEGAVGVFISGTRTDTSAALDGGQGNTGYVGGFVACPYDDASNQCERP